MTTILRFDANGVIDCLYNEAIDLRTLGTLEITRATDIRFCGTFQQWQVHDAESDTVLFKNPSRSECLRWEYDNLQPSASPT